MIMKMNVLCCIAFTTCCVHAASVMTNGYTWTYYDVDGGRCLGDLAYYNYGWRGVGCAITPKPEGELVIPSTLAGDKITRIAGLAFENCTDMTSVIIPDYATIDSGSFAGCGKLENIVISHVPNGVLGSLFQWKEKSESCDGYSAWQLTRNGYFYIPLSLRSVTLTNGECFNNPGSYADYSGVFYGCESLTTINLPEDINRIPDRAFCHCRNLRAIAIPNNVTNIGTSAFNNCRSLTEIIIPDKVTALGAWAFSDCKELKSIKMSNGIRSIDRTTFFNCGKLTDITIPQFVCSTNMASMFVYAYQSVTNVIIADGVTRISQNCFAGCKSLQSVTIPVNVTQIGNSSFADCTNLARVELPNDVGTLTVGADAFNNGTIVEVQERIGYTVYWTNTLGEVVADPFHSSVEVTVSPCWQRPQVVAPTIEPSTSASFANVSQDVSISCVDTAATILYTIDGNDPSVNGLEYTGPFTLYESRMIRAIARKYDIEGGFWMRDSEEVKVTLTRAEPLSEAVNLYGYLMETDTGNPWTVVTDVSHDGVSCARSGAIGHGGVTWLQISIRKAGTVSFWWKAACEEAEEEDGETYWYDYGVFLVDGVEKAKIAGNDTGWRKVEVEVPSGGKHVLRWEYRKDGATSYSPDCIWLDQVQWIPADDNGYTLTTPEPVPYSWLRGYNLGLDSDFETAAKSLNGKNTGGKAMSVWQDYVAGTDPTNVNSVFTAAIEMVDGLPHVTWSPNLNTNGEVRVYTVFGKTNLTDAAWVCPTNAAHRFFKVKVEMP